MTDQDQTPATEDATLVPIAKAPQQLRRVTKSTQLAKMLATKRGADVAAISAKFGWQPHTTRAALSGLRRAGFDVHKANAGPGKPARYRIVTNGAADGAKESPNAG